MVLSHRTVGEGILEAIHLVPSSTSEVRHLDRSAAVLDGNGTEFTDAAPFCKVIYVHIERKSVVETVVQTVVHKEVHSAMSADLLCKCLEVIIKNRCRIHFLKFLHYTFRKGSVEVDTVSFIHKAVAFCLIVTYDKTDVLSLSLADAPLLYRVFRSIAFCSNKLVHSVVRTRRHHIVFDKVWTCRFR